MVVILRACGALSLPRLPFVGSIKSSNGETEGGRLVRITQSERGHYLPLSPPLGRIMLGSDEISINRTKSIQCFSSSYSLGFKDEDLENSLSGGLIL